MSVVRSYLSTGLPEIDALFKGLIPGDNIVWNTDSVDEYRLLAAPFVEHALAAGQQVTYLRFSEHAPLAEPDDGLNVVTLSPSAGFEAFINGIHGVIEANGTGGLYLFDCLTDLVDSWHSDEMLGNFFKLTCPYLLDVEAIAYFNVLKKRHSQNALQPIQTTAQVVTDVYRLNDRLFLHPIKVQQRYSPTMHMLHEWHDGEATPVNQSGLTARIHSSEPWAGQASASKVFDRWNQAFVQAEYLLSDPRGVDQAQAAELRHSLLRMMFSREERILELAEQYLQLDDLAAIGRRMIGTGLVGGKSAGMLLAHAALRSSEDVRDISFEKLDSFYIGSDVFYSYLVRNGCWWARQQRDLDSLLHNARHARRIILTGQFAPEMVERFSAMLDYFGQAPILVRSSSLLEDSFGNAFSGKYESVFCPNQGSRTKCLDNLLAAIRTVYASTMSEKAIRYRAQYGLLEHDEQMSLLVQRVSGGLSGSYFYPLLAGVGYSFNPYVWGDGIDADSGVLRLVFGLGTRAVDRADNDYTRLVALNAPLRCPGAGGDDGRKHSQHTADAIDLNANRVVSLDCDDLLDGAPEDWRTPVASNIPVRQGRDGRTVMVRTVGFDSLLRDTDFADRMRRSLHALQVAYGCPVDVEFTANLSARGAWDIGIVQCRPFQVRQTDGTVDVAVGPPQGHRVLACTGPIIGISRDVRIERIVFIDPDAYGLLPSRTRFTVARMVGQVLRSPEMRDRSVLLMGPGRWGSSMPELGVPATFADICHAAVLCEVAMMHSGLVPDISLGTHFFNDLVEKDILYLGVHPNLDDTEIDWRYLRNAPCVDLPSLGDAAGRVAEMMRVIDCEAMMTTPLRLYADSRQQQAVLGFS